jgi:hypothetical protein
MENLVISVAMECIIRVRLSPAKRRTFSASTKSLVPSPPLNLYVGTCSQSQGDPTRVNNDVNRVLAQDDNSSVNLPSHGHYAGVFIGV